MINFRKTLVAALAVATLAGAVAATSTEASAYGFHHWGWGFGAAAIAAPGLAIAASQPHYYDDGYGCYFARQAVADEYGNFIGYQRVRVCD